MLVKLLELQSAQFRYARSWIYSAMMSCEFLATSGLDIIGRYVLKLYTMHRNWSGRWDYCIII